MLWIFRFSKSKKVVLYFCLFHQNNCRLLSLSSFSLSIKNITQNFVQLIRKYKSPNLFLSWFFNLSKFCDFAFSSSKCNLNFLNPDLIEPLIVTNYFFFNLKIKLGKKMFLSYNVIIICCRVAAAYWNHVKCCHSGKICLPPGPIDFAEHVIQGSQEVMPGETINITSI